MSVFELPNGQSTLEDDVLQSDIHTILYTCLSLQTELRSVSNLNTTLVI